MNNLNRFVCHGEKSVYELRTIAQEPFSFISSGQDGTCKWYDIRQSTKCDKLFCQEHTLIKLSTGITAIAINPVVPYHLVCSGLDGILRFFDRRMLSVGLCDSDHHLVLFQISRLKVCLLVSGYLAQLNSAIVRGKAFLIVLLLAINE